MTSAHNIASGFDRAGLGLAGVAASFIQDARARQAAVDEEQAYRNLSAAQRAAVAVARQRAALQDAVDENAALKAENARLQRELAAARQQVVAQQSETVRIKRLLRGAVGLRAA